MNVAVQGDVGLFFFDESADSHTTDVNIQRDMVNRFSVQRRPVKIRIVGWAVEQEHSLIKFCITHQCVQVFLDGGIADDIVWHRDRAPTFLGRHATWRYVAADIILFPVLERKRGRWYVRVAIHCVFVYGETPFLSVAPQVGKPLLEEYVLFKLHIIVPKDQKDMRVIAAQMFLEITKLHSQEIPNEIFVGVKEQRGWEEITTQEDCRRTFLADSPKKLLVPVFMTVQIGGEETLFQCTYLLLIG